MSRIGNKIIEIPDKVNVEVLTDHVKVSGPKGSLSVYVNEGLKVTQESNTVSLERPSDSRTFRSLHGTCLLYTSPSPRDLSTSRMPSSA